MKHNALDRSSVELDMIVTDVVNSPSDILDRTLPHLIGSAPSDQFSTATPGQIVKDHGSSYSFSTPLTNQAPLYNQKDGTFYRYNGSEWVKVGKLYKIDGSNNNLKINVHDLVFVDDAIRVQLQNPPPNSAPIKPSRLNEYRITVNNYDDMVIQSIDKAVLDGISDDGTDNGQYPLSMRVSKLKWENVIDNSLNGTFLSLDSTTLITIINGAKVSHRTAERTNMLFYCRNSKLLYWNYYHEYVDGGNTYSSSFSAPYILISNMSDLASAPIHGALDVSVIENQAQYINYMYPQLNEGADYEKEWAKRGFYMNSDGSMGSNWELITIKRVITNEEAINKQLTLPYTVFGNDPTSTKKSILLSCGGIEQYEGIDFTHSGDKVISWNDPSLGLHDIVEENDVMVITYITADKDR